MTTRHFQALLLALLLAPGFQARADYSDNLAACSIREPDTEMDPHPDNGFDLGFILSQEVYKNGTMTANVEPTLLVQMSSGDEMTNLTAGPTSKPLRLVFSDSSRDGYRVLDYSWTNFGAGAQAVFNFPNTTFLSSALWASVGIMPTKGKASSAERFYANRDAAEDRDDMPKLDDALKAFEKMHVNDTLSYSTSGGIVFWAGIGASVIGITAPAMAVGEFQVYMEKIDADHVFVKVTDSNLRSFGLQAGALVGSMSISEFTRHATNLGFEINVRDAMGRKAFHDVVHGNLAPVQKLAASAGLSSVKFADEGKMTRKGHYSHYKLGVPFLFKFTWNKNRYSEVARKRFYDCGRELEATYGTFFANRESKLFGVSQSYQKAFYGTAYGLQNAQTKRSIARGFFGDMTWSYRGYKTMAKSFRKAMEKLADATGLGDDVMLHIPSSITERLDYTSITLRAHMGAQHTLNMINRAKKAGRERLLAFATMEAQKWTSSVVGSDAICESLDLPENTKMETSACQVEVMSRTERGVDTMLESLLTVSDALRRSNLKLATKAYARFGEAMLTNQFTFQTALRLAGANLPVDFIVEGADFYSYTRPMKTVGSTGRLADDNRPPILDRTRGRGQGLTDSVVVQPQL